MDEWGPERLVVCPCCRNQYDTDEHVPFSPERADLYAAAPDLLAACRAAFTALLDGGEVWGD